MTGRCDVTELERAACAHCRGLPDPGEEPMVAAGEPVPGATVRAYWPGKCGGCGEPFEAGSLIMRHPDGDGWIADCCSEGA